MPKRKKQQGGNGWDALPWSSVKVRGDIGSSVNGLNHARAPRGALADSDACDGRKE